MTCLSIVTFRNLLTLCLLLWNRHWARGQKEDASSPPKASNENSTMCAIHHHRRRHPNPPQAYRMAVLASLAYYPFHRRHTDGFDSFRVTGRRRRLGRWLGCRVRRGASRLQRLFRRRSGGATPPTPCARWMHQRQTHRRRNDYTLHYYLYDWFEPTVVPGVNYHDTDLLIATSRRGNVLALSFAGTSSPSDHATNIQTFERANHSGVFHGGGNVLLDNNTRVIHGSIHRGFLNAYSRVNRGSVVALRPQNATTATRIKRSLTRSFDQRYGHCLPKSQRRQQRRHQKRSEQDEEATNTSGVDPADALSDYSPSSSNAAFETSIVKRKRNGGCHTHGESLMTVLREVITEALVNGKTVRLSGHSLGGGLATLAALDIVINFPNVPVSRLHLWTFGAPQVADEAFFHSALNAAPRLHSFVDRRFHRFVTLSDQCVVDFVTQVAQNALPYHRRNFGGRAARRLGGVTGKVIHFAEPLYLFTSNQHFDVHNGSNDSNNSNSSSTDNERPLYKTNTKTSLDAHSMFNYLEGISRESRQHPLSTDLPAKVRKEWVGENTLP